MPTRLIIHAPNIHKGGGKTLLIALLNNLPKDGEACLVMDERLRLPDVLSCRTRKVKPSVVDRFSAEIWLRREVGPNDVVLCLGNLPPLFKLRGVVKVFVQNRYLVDPRRLSGFPIKTRLKIKIENLWLVLGLRNADELIVQSPSMKNLLSARANRKPVNVVPFMVQDVCYRRDSAQPATKGGKEFDFLYVASGEPHKNHRKLVSAWCRLASESLYPSLLLTLDQSECSDLCKWINWQTEQHQLKITNIGGLENVQIAEIYSRSGALVYPSTFESFGLPLIEASQAGLPIVASELDFVRDVLDPIETFDPDSSVSIARAIKRYLKRPEQALPLRNAAGFLEHILRY